MSTSKQVSKKSAIAVAALVTVAMTPMQAMAETPEPQEADCLIEIETPWGRVKLICGLL